jgi:Rps23 Pro-64 3,4-dihydroxylase Tpa1-like proline 4-hydroxylase
MEQGEPETKKFKHSIFSDCMYDPEYRDVFYNHWHNRTNYKSPNVEVIGKPFRVCKISNFIKNEDFMDNIKSELVDIKTRRNSTDLYQFEQSNDLVTVNKPTVQVFYETFQTDLVDWLEKFTKLSLNKKISMSTSCYTDTDYLLCHDDYLGDRKIAYILYLSENWKVEDGGSLDLFDTDENGRPKNVVKSLLPEYNSLIFFEVVNNSYHQVAEVMTGTKSRWSINGWFHGPIAQVERCNKPEPTFNFLNPEYTEIDLNLWISKVYLYPGIVKEIQEDVEQESFAFLSDFLKPNVYERLCNELQSDSIKWKFVGPADIRNYEVADEDSLPAFLGEFYKIFRSITVFQLLKNYTELDLVPESESMNPKMTIELQRWSKGCYTLISDKATYQDEPEGETTGLAPGSTPGLASAQTAATESAAASTSTVSPATASVQGQAENYDKTVNEAQSQVGANIEVEAEVEIKQDNVSVNNSNEKKFKNKKCKSDNYEAEGSCSTSSGAIKKRKNYYDESSASNKINNNADCNTPNRQGGDEDDDNVNKIKCKTKNKSSGSEPNTDGYNQNLPAKNDGTTPVKNRKDTDTDDSDVSDIGDYLSDPLDCEHSGQEDAIGEGPFLEDGLEEEEEEEDNVEEPGSLDVIMQFNTNGTIDTETIDYVDLKEENGALIHVPSKDNHLCLVYKTLGICRVHKYVNHYCKGYFYNLVCTYCE